MKDKKKILKHIGVNLVIVLMLSGLCVLAFNNEIRSVFVSQTDDVFYRGDTSQNNISLMINVYWGNEYLPSMLQTLQEYDVKTTFFVGGMWVAKYPEELIKIYEQGHEIANHGFFHKDQSKMTFSENQQEIINTHKLVKEYLGIEMNLFAPPSGAFNENTIQAAQALDYQVIMWSRDTIDWRDHNADLIYTRATQNLSNGELVLMHPTLETATVLPRILEYCKEHSLNVVPVSSTILI